MPGPTPNPNSIGRDRHYQWTILADEPSGLEAPLYASVHPFDDQSHKLWRLWWEGPLGVLYHPEIDADALERLLWLKQKAREPLVFDDAGKPVNRVTAADLGEIRQLEDRFGLSPAGRRKLFVKLEGTDVEGKAVPAPASGDDGPAEAPKAGGGDDPRRLRSVG